MSTPKSDTQPANEKGMVRVPVETLRELLAVLRECDVRMDTHGDEFDDRFVTVKEELERSLAAAPRALPADDEMAAFGASDYACYKYPEEDHQKERAAFCEGAAHIASTQVAEITRLTAALAEAIDMVLHCPRCGVQHIDAPDARTPDWNNPPHKSHLCHGCGCIWRPADRPTNGVAAIKLNGVNDTWVPGCDTAAKALAEERAKGESMAKALGPFAKCLPRFVDGKSEPVPDAPDETPLVVNGWDYDPANADFTVGDLREAAAALEQSR